MIKIVKQGSTVIEGSDREGFMVMHPDGSVEGAIDRGQAEKLAKRWYSKNLGRTGVGIGSIEWR